MSPSNRTHRAEIKYNVTTDFPRLDLHSACASGNLGLVKYAIDNGQPINSVLDGVLPLHAACAGGDETIVAYLIRCGAHVNAPRLPLKYSSANERSADKLTIGTSGSTPLHFAAANNRLGVVRLLLAHGANAVQPDKHGVTPEMVARENGHLECADVIREAGLGPSMLVPPPGMASSISGESTSTSTTASHDTHSHLLQSPVKRLLMKKSMDNAFHLFKRDTNSPSRVCTPLPPSPTSPTSASTHVRSMTNGSDSPIPGTEADFPEQRRPSLPQIFDASSGKSPPGHGLVHLRAKLHRPRSAGTDSDADASGVSTLSGRKLKTKVSLLGLFNKKASPSDTHADQAKNYATSKHSYDGMPTSMTPEPSGSSFEQQGPLVILRTPSSNSGSTTGSGSQQHSATRPSILRHYRSSSSHLGSSLGLVLGGSGSASTNGGPPRALRFDSASSQESTNQLGLSTSPSSPPIPPLRSALRKTSLTSSPAPVPIPVTRPRSRTRVSSPSPRRSARNALGGLRGSTSVGSLRLTNWDSNRDGNWSAPSTKERFEGRMRGRSFASQSSEYGSIAANGVYEDVFIEGSERAGTDSPHSTDELELDAQINESPVGPLRPDVELDADAELDADPDLDSCSSPVDEEVPAPPFLAYGNKMPYVTNLREAEALVLRTQREIIESGGYALDVEPINGNSVISSNMASSDAASKLPLSAQLELYGEMLALERRFAKGEKQREQWERDRERAIEGREDSEDDLEAQYLPALATRSPKLSAGGLSPTANRKFAASMAKENKRVRRPHTSEGPPSPSQTSAGAWGSGTNSHRPRRATSPKPAERGKTTTFHLEDLEAKTEMQYQQAKTRVARSLHSHRSNPTLRFGTVSSADGTLEEGSPQSQPSVVFSPASPTSPMTHTSSRSMDNTVQHAPVFRISTEVPHTPESLPSSASTARNLGPSPVTVVQSTTPPNLSTFPTASSTSPPTTNSASAISSPFLPATRVMSQPSKLLKYSPGRKNGFYSTVDVPDSVSNGTLSGSLRSRSGSGGSSTVRVFGGIKSLMQSLKGK